MGFKIYDAFPTKGMAQSAAEDLRAGGSRARVKKLNPPQDGGRLKYGLYTDDPRLV